MFAMKDSGARKETGKDRIKALRDSRKLSIEQLSRTMKEQRKTFDAVRRQLVEGPRTVPEIASALGAPSSQIMWCIASLKKYGEVAEAEKDGSYFRYELAGGTAAGAAAGSTEEG
jgi:hypothetical protein